MQMEWLNFMTNKVLNQKKVKQDNRTKKANIKILV